MRRTIVYFFLCGAPKRIISSESFFIQPSILSIAVTPAIQLTVPLIYLMLSDLI
ncbi:hypothetical protein [Leptospira ilyithenensis]|uniref:hypothetical protein n=1 Tax=Leptospira ilyithenensis TaxID=2484901 RepID=UPI0014385E0D|nr:hypothetical protein [Leptospira ilyithenensis]